MYKPDSIKEAFVLDWKLIETFYPEATISNTSTNYTHIRAEIRDIIAYWLKGIQLYLMC